MAMLLLLDVSMVKVYDAWTYDTTPNVQPRGKKSGKTAHPEGTISIYKLRAFLNVYNIC